MKIRRVIIFCIIILLLGGVAYYKKDIQGRAILDYPREECFVERVIDGDTIVCEIEGITQSVRLLGINTPEKGKPYYAEAKEYLAEIENKTIEILRDKTDLDKYYRKLRYVFYNNKNLNIVLVEKGLATAYMTDGLRYREKFIRAQDLAKDLEVGIWEQSNAQCSKCINLIELNATEEYFVLKNECNYDCKLDGWFVKDASRNVFWLDNLDAKDMIIINSSKSIWNNDHDEFFMRDKEGLLVEYYSY